MINLINHFLIFLDNGLMTINHGLSLKSCLLLATFFLFILIILKLRFEKKVTKKLISSTELNVCSFNTIAGEDVLIAQLDLARALIEIGQKTEAQIILQEVVQQGTSDQRRTALKLLAISV